MSTEERTLTVPVAEPAAEPEVEEQQPEPEAGGGAHGAGHDIHLPPESLWPITGAFGITLMFFGFVTNFLVSIPGIVIFAIALRGWAQELLHAKH